MNPTEQIQKKIEGDIENVGWSAIGVFPTQDQPDTPHFLYTIGVTDTHDHPELIITGLSANLAHGIVSRVVELIAEGKRFDTRQRSDEVLEGYPVEFLPVTQENRDEYLKAAKVRYSDIPDEWAAVQIVHPDPEKRMPWEEGFDDTGADQPVLGEVE